jgi:formylglycine-generating enzyme required for sulfatase activity
MLYVPAGRSLYGSGDLEEIRHFLTHEPMHDIEVGTFLIARTEVTNSEYLAFLGALPEAERKARLASGLVLTGDGRIAWTLLDKTLAPGDRYCSGIQPCVDWSVLPVNGASRDDGEHYTEWLSRSGRLPGARLCTDREWERAARGADDRKFPNGNGDPGPDDACTMTAYGDDERKVGPCAAGTHPASRSPFGVDDMMGSEWEWTAGPADVRQSKEGVVRGAGFDDDRVYLTLTNRAILGVGLRLASSAIGLRVCADVGDAK